MKLKNKKTGEVKNFTLVVVNGYAGDGTLAELNEEWEDYEELKRDYWCIDWDGTLKNIIVLDDVDEWTENRKEIGNYFETREEAEKAVEKLKAWKRLKDKGFRFTGINDNEESQIMIYECGVLCKANIEHRLSKDEDFILLFGEDEDELRKQKG